MHALAFPFILSVALLLTACGGSGESSSPKPGTVSSVASSIVASATSSSATILSASAASLTSSAVSVASSETSLTSSEALVVVSSSADGLPDTVASSALYSAFSSFSQLTSGGASQSYAISSSAASTHTESSASNNHESAASVSNVTSSFSSSFSSSRSNNTSSAASAAASIPSLATQGAMAYFSFLTARADYPYTCASCHGNIPQGENLRRISATKATYGSRQLPLATYIEQEMPQIATYLCDHACALATTAYIQSWNAPASEAPYIFAAENFDGATSLAAKGWHTRIDGNVNPPQTGATEMSRVMIDNREDNNGQLYIESRDGREAVGVFALPGNLAQLHVRAWIKLAQPLADGDLLVGFKNSLQHNYDDIWLGQHEGRLALTLSATQSRALAAPETRLETQQWHCLEVGVSGYWDARRSNQQFDRLTLAVDGAEILRIDQSAHWKAATPRADWLVGRLNYFFVGLHSASGQDNRLWVDDLVMAVHPIGCGEPPATHE